MRWSGASKTFLMRKHTNLCTPSFYKVTMRHIELKLQLSTGLFHIRSFNM